MQKERSIKIRQKLNSAKKSEILAVIILILSFLLMMLCITRPSFGQVTASNGALAQSSKGLYDVDASGTDVKIVLEALARRSGANIVVSPDIAGNITIHLKKMPIEQILDNISKVHGFVWEKKDDTYLVASKDMLKPAYLEIEKETPEDAVLVFEFKYVDPNDAEKTIKTMFPELRTSVGPAPLRPQLSSDKTALSFISDASALSTNPLSQDRNKIKLVVMGKEELVKKAEQVLKQLDKPRPQVKIDVSIVEIKNNAKKDLGIEWDWTDIRIVETGPTSGVRFGKFTKAGQVFNGKLSLMIENGSANLLAQPNVSVLDGEVADILIGDRLLYPKLVSYSDNGIPIYDTDEVRVGIYLQIASKVTQDDEIMLNLYPQVSLVTGYLKTQAGDYPQISTRQAKTTVSVKSGATIAIGGLIREEELKNYTKIPFLSDIPIIGNLFKHSKKTKDRTELVIFLTPKIVSFDEKGEAIEN